MSCGTPNTTGFAVSAEVENDATLQPRATLGAGLLHDRSEAPLSALECPHHDSAVIGRQNVCPTVPRQTERAGRTLPSSSQDLLRRDKQPGYTIVAGLDILPAQAWAKLASTSR